MIFMLLLVLKILVLAMLACLSLVLLLLLAAILVPFRIKGTFKNGGEYEAATCIEWLWGTLGLMLVLRPHKKFVSPTLFKIKTITYTIKAKSAEAKKEKAQKRTEKKIQKQAKKKGTEEKERLFAQELFEQIGDLSRKLSLEAFEQVIHFPLNLLASLKIKLTGEVQVGLGDPADTGRLLGAYYAIKGALNINSFSLYPYWDDLMLKGNATLSMRIWLADILRIAIKIALTSSIRKIWWPYLKNKLNIVQRLRPQTIKQ